jgi:hypothetical protein
MPKRLVLIHTVAPLVETFSRLCKEILPGVEVFHVLDEPMLEQVRKHGSLDFEYSSPKNIPGPDASDRLMEHLLAAEDIGADAVLVTCSTVSPYLDEDVPASIPVVKIDEAMIERAVEEGAHVGVLATNPTTLEPTRASLLAQAQAVGKQIDIEMLLVEGAFAAFLRGDGAEHDRLVGDAIQKMSGQVDLIVLAQASMARALVPAPEARGVPDTALTIPVLTSPHTALQRVKEILTEVK